jgi:hypothetical protein
MGPSFDPSVGDLLAILAVSDVAVVAHGKVCV